MSKKSISKRYRIIVLVLLILILAGGGYFWKTNRAQKPVTDVVNPVKPAASVQGVNPYDKTNPFSNIKVNPFE